MNLTFPELEALLNRNRQTLMKLILEDEERKNIEADIDTKDSSVDD